MSDHRQDQGLVYFLLFFAWFFIMLDLPSYHQCLLVTWSSFVTVSWDSIHNTIKLLSLLVGLVGPCAYWRCLKVLTVFCSEFDNYGNNIALKYLKQFWKTFTWLDQLDDRCILLAEVIVVLSQYLQTSLHVIMYSHQSHQLFKVIIFWNWSSLRNFPVTSPCFAPGHVRA